MTSVEQLARILGVDAAMLERLGETMGARTGRPRVLESLAERNAETIARTLRALNHGGRSAEQVRGVLRTAIVEHEQRLLALVEREEGASLFEKAAALARKITTSGKGFFLKKEIARAILQKRPPGNLLSYLGVRTVDEALAGRDVTELFSALRFVESDEWMHATFDEAYREFTAADFEERGTEIRVLGPEWHEISKQFVEKKHHNVSHLKEFGVIFVNPIAENIPGKFLRDFALVLHYFHEIEFYAKLFRHYSRRERFSQYLAMFLRGDVPEVDRAGDGEWLIVQRYLAKVNPADPRLTLPRVNPESLHWARGERDLTSFKVPDAHLDLTLWHDLDWVGGIFADGEAQTVSFDLEDNAMSLVSFMEGKNETFNYHQRESMWTKIFEEYAGGEEKMEALLIENFDKGIIQF